MTTINVLRFNYNNANRNKSKPTLTAKKKINFLPLQKQAENNNIPIKLSKK